MFTNELARRLEGTGITANSLHPGIVRTGFGADDQARLFAVVSKLVLPFLKTPAQGAQTSIYLASSPSVEGMTGKYFFDSHVTPTAPQATDMAVARKLWDVSTEMVHRQAGRSAISASDDKK